MSRNRSDALDVPVDCRNNDPLDRLLVETAVEVLSLVRVHVVLADGWYLRFDSLNTEIDQRVLARRQVMNRPLPGVGACCQDACC